VGGVKIVGSREKSREEGKGGKIFGKISNNGEKKGKNRTEGGQVEGTREYTPKKP